MIFRHTVGSLLALKNVNLRQIQDYLGHGSIRSTERYTHLQHEAKHNALNVINDEMNTVFTNAINEVYAK